MSANGVPMDELDRFQTDILFLLVGTNPLPNYVSGLLLSPDNGQLYLLHTNNTLPFAERLKKEIENHGSNRTIVLWEISKSNATLIENQLEPIINELGPNAKIGLNYTGGSKPMAAKVYQTLRNSYPRGTFSYLDAETLSLNIESPNLPMQEIAIGNKVQVSFETLRALHGYQSSEQRTKISPIGLRQALLKVHSTEQGCQDWRNWLLTFNQGSPQLPQLSQYPSLTPVIQEFENLCGNDTLTVETLAKRLGNEKGQLISCTKILLGEWLEDVVYEILKGMAAEQNLHQVGLGVKLKRPLVRDFEFDIVAMLGYQLIAISCIVTQKKDQAKYHFFETIIRARQLGGDEAKFALVCCYDDPEMLERQIDQGLGMEGKIRVFGRKHLLTLESNLKEWIISIG
jgi:hypothetical protein